MPARINPYDRTAPPGARMSPRHDTPEPAGALAQAQALENSGIFAPLAGASGLSSSATINAATSSGVRPGRSAGLARRSISVSTAPGLRQMALMPCSRPSTAIASVRPMTPYLDTLYAASPGNFSVAYTPDSDAMFTIRPSPAGTMAANAARQHRNMPVRLTSSVSRHMADVVSPNGAGVSTPAAQTRALSWPVAVASANRRSTAVSSLTSVGTGVAWPPASLIRPATSCRARWSLAASTTWAPAAATAAAVAAPIPRLAPVTTASRPASQCRSAISHPPVQALVSVKAQLQVKLALGVLAAGRPRNLGYLRHRIAGGQDVVGRYQETSYAVQDHLAEAAAPERDNGSPARLRLGGGQPEGLVPAGRIQHYGRPGHGLPQRGPGHCLVDGHARPASPRVDLLPAVSGVVDVAVDVDRYPGRAGDIDGLGRPLLRAQPAREQRALPGRPRPGNDARGRVGRQDRVHGDDSAPGAGLEVRYDGHGRRPASPTGMAQRRRHSLVRRQVERVHHGCLQHCREPDGGRVEGMIVDHVVLDHLHGQVGGGESGLGGGRRSGLFWLACRWPERAVERSRQGLRIDSGVDYLDARDLRSGGGIDVHLVAPAGQPAGQVGHERLRAAALRLADGRHQRRHDRDLHPALAGAFGGVAPPGRHSTLKARSRGGLRPSTSKGTLRSPRRRTASAALG